MNFGGKIMKKTLLILLSLILCLSFTFTACNTDVEFGNDDTNNTEESDKATEDTRPAPSGVDKSIAKNSLNKIDLSTLMGSTENSFDVFADLVAGFELNIAGVMYGEEGNASIKAAFEEGKIYLGERSEGVPPPKKIVSIPIFSSLLYSEISSIRALTYFSSYSQRALPKETKSQYAHLLLQNGI